MAEKRLEWVIIDSNLGTYTNLDGEWEDAPGWDCQIILFREPETGWAMRHGGDWFRLDDAGAPIALDNVGMLDFIVNILGIVKAGRMLPKHQWNEVYQYGKCELARLKETD